MAKRKSRLAGYRLHKERILFSGGQVIRTIKFPLAPLNPSEETAQFLKDFERAIIADDLKIRGDLNINDYINSAFGEKNYTLVDFWIDCLRSGVIWQPSKAFLIHLVNKLYSQPAAWRLIEEAKSDIPKFFDKEKFSKNFILPDQIRGGKKEKNFKQDLIESLEDEYRDTKEKIEDVDIYLEKFVHSDAKELILKITNCFFSNGKLITDSLGEGKTKRQNQLWEEKFGINKSKLLDHFKLPDHLKNFEKISFFIIPELSYPQNNFDELIEIRKNWLVKQNLCSSEDEKTLKEELRNLVGLSNNCNPLSNFLGTIFCILLNSKMNKNEILARFYEVFTIIEPKIVGLNKEFEIINSLDYIAENAKKLGIPKIVNFNLNTNQKGNEKESYEGWSKYRQNFGSKMQSWFTNYQDRDKQLEEQLNKFKNSLTKAKQYLENMQSQEGAEKKDQDKQREDILELLKLFNKFFTDEDKGIKNEENYLLFSSLLALAKRRLNFFYQAYIQKEGDETKVNNFTPFKGLYERIYKPVAFYGYSARRANEKFIHKTIPIIEDGIGNIQKLAKYLHESFSPKDKFEEVRRDKETAEDTYRKFLQFFWNKYVDASINSSLFLEKYEKIIKESIEDNKWKEINDKNKKGRYVFYKSPYAKGSLEKIPIKTNSYLEQFQTSVLGLAEFILSFKKDTLLSDSAILLDWIEVSKNIISILLRFNAKETYKLDGLLLENFSQAKRYQELFRREDYPKNEFSFIIQSLILSEIRGAATLYSKREYIASYSVQVVNSDEKFKLYYIPKEEIPITADTIQSKPDSVERRQLMKPHNFAVALDKVSEKKKNQSFNAILLSKSNITAVFLPDESLQKLCKLSSSPYQLQFLDKYLYRPAGWENTDISLSEWNFVVEKRYKINWDLQTKKPKLLPVISSEQAKKDKVYLAIPFNLSPNNQIKQSAPLKSIAKGNEKIEKDLSRLNYPILGVDVGEYGLAYCLVKFDFDKNTYKITGVELGSDKEEVLGFIEDRNIGNIKDKFSEIQQKARQGAFDAEDTVVARVRENAIGHLRNRIHVVVTQEKSSSVYEDSITNFETGSGRTTKIYNSVKRADTESNTEADEQIHTHIWGEKTKWVGRNVSAYASSYTCVSCLKSIYQIKKEDLSKMTITQKDGRVVTISSPYGDMKGYASKEEKYDVGYQFRGTDEDFKKLRKIVQDFARPPVGNRSEVLEKYAKQILETGRIEEWRKRRGNSSIFVCPFCQYVADADIQAAFMMAVRGYLRFSGIVPSLNNKKKQDQEEEKTAGESFLEQTQKQLENIDRSRIKNAFLLKI